MGRARTYPDRTRHHLAAIQLASVVDVHVRHTTEAPLTERRFGRSAVEHSALKRVRLVRLRCVHSERRFLATNRRVVRLR